MKTGSDFQKLGLIAAVALIGSTLLFAAKFGLFRKAREGSPGSVLVNLARIDSAKEYWVLEKKGAPNSWPTPRDLMPFLASDTNRPFADVVPSVSGEIYIINRADRPALAYFPFGTRGDRQGQLISQADTFSVTTNSVPNNTAASPTPK